VGTSDLTVQQLGKDLYKITPGNKARGTVLYQKMGSDSQPYEVGYSEDGERITCTCKGFRFNEKCKHCTNYEEIFPTLQFSATPKPVVEIEEGRVARDGVEPVVDAIVDRLSEVCRVEPAGSWRRGRDSIRDLDFVTTANPEEISELCGEGEEISTSGTKVIRFTTEYEVGVTPIQIDFCLTDKERWGAGLLYLTGSAEFNIWMRRLAKANKMKLTRNGLLNRETGEVLASQSEREIFTVLGLSYIPPGVREKQEDWLAYLKE